MAITAESKIRPWKNVEIRHYPEDASQTFKRGEVLILGGAGVENKVKVAASNPTAAIVGIAAENASGVTGNKVAVYLAKPESVFVGYIDGTDAVDFTDIGAARALEDNATEEVWTIETDDAGNDSVVVLAYRDVTTKQVLTAEGGTEALVEFRFIRAATLFGDDDNA
jgi:hypothetical protein